MEKGKCVASPLIWAIFAFSCFPDYLFFCAQVASTLPVWYWWVLDNFQDPVEVQRTSWAALRLLRRQHVLQPGSYLCLCLWVYPSLAEKVTHEKIGCSQSQQELP